MRPLHCKAVPGWGALEFVWLLPRFRIAETGGEGASIVVPADSGVRICPERLFPGATGPAVAQARAVLEKEIQKFSQGCIQLLEFRKTEEKEMERLMTVSATALASSVPSLMQPGAERGGARSG